MPLTLTVETEAEGRYQVLTVLGEVDIATVPQLSERIAELSQSGYLVLDLTETDFMDSSGLRLLLETRERFDDEGRAFRLAISGGPIARLLDVTGLLTHLEVHDTVEEAISA